jgi:hypothetical protein
MTGNLTTELFREKILGFDGGQINVWVVHKGRNKEMVVHSSGKKLESTRAAITTTTIESRIQL